MSSFADTNEIPGDAPPTTQPLAITRPWYWSVRRELWESRWLYLAPLAIATLVLFACFISALSLPRKMRNLSNPTPERQHSVVISPFKIAPAPIMMATLLVGFFYSLDALYGERRDRSILFWKSLPVSDRTTVLAKASIPMLVLPLIAFALSVAVSVILLMVTNAVVLATGLNPARLWGELHFIERVFVMFYGLTVHALWFAPLYGWLLFISAWARRAPLVWAVLPVLALAAVERMTFGSSWFLSLVKYRFNGAIKTAFDFGKPHSELSQLTPLNFVTTPGLWIGLLVAAGFLAATVKLRRNREPI
jgi:ABC-2 type transport system permease protein